MTYAQVGKWGSYTHRKARGVSPKEYIYAILNRKAKAIKFGISIDPSSRLRDLQVGNAEKLELLGQWEGVREDEIGLHRTFASDRKNGEWFALSRPINVFLLERLRIDLSELIGYGYRNYQDRPAIADVAPIQPDHLEVLQSLKEVCAIIELKKKYQLPTSAYGSWHHHVKYVAKQHCVEPKTIICETYRTVGGEPRMEPRNGYPEWIWLAGWMLYAQQTLNLSYFKAWEIIQGQVFREAAEAPLPPEELDGTAKLHCRINELQAAMKKLQIDYNALVDNGKAMSRLLKDYQDKLAELDGAFREHLHLDLLAPGISKKIAEKMTVIGKQSQAYEKIKAFIDKQTEATETGNTKTD